MIPDLNQKKLDKSIIIEDWADVEHSPVMQLHVKRYKMAKELMATGPGYVNILLDLGCGTGYGSNMLKNLSKKVVGIDISPIVIDYAKTCYKQCEFFVRSIYEPFPFTDNSIDVVTCFGVCSDDIEGSGEKEVSLCKEVKRVLKEGGMFIGSGTSLVNAMIKTFQNTEQYEVEGFDELTGKVVIKGVK